MKIIDERKTKKEKKRKKKREIEKNKGDKSYSKIVIAK